jgi:hypothetical protein
MVPNEADRVFRLRVCTSSHDAWLSLGSGLDWIDALHTRGARRLVYSTNIPMLPIFFHARCEHTLVRSYDSRGYHSLAAVLSHDLITLFDDPR